MSRRIEQVNQLLQKELGELFLREVEFPKNCLVTITKVETSADLKWAKVWISILPIKFAGRVLEILNKKASYFQSLLGKKLFIKFIPKIIFQVDRTEEEASEIERILDQIKKEQ